MTDQSASNAPVQSALQGKLRPPAVSLSILGWLRANLFNNWYNSVITLVLLWLLYVLIPPIFQWLVSDAVWWAAPPEVCRAAGGACWAFIHEKARLILFGLYPYDEQWRPALSVMLLLGLIGASLNRFFWNAWLIAAWIVGGTIIGCLMAGGVLGLPPVETSRWGGLPLTLGLATIGLAVAFPVGIVLALARRSTMPAIRTVSIVYIELIRGVPLITILFMSSIIIPLFLPTGVGIDRVLRAQIGMIMFASAYLAEVVRGGLQAIPGGQYEAADSLGLGYWQKMRLIVLPQALKISIPPIVNTFIGFFKDTSLVIIIGLFDLVGAAKSALTDPSWRGFYKEAYFFIAVIYFIFCYFMSWYSQYLERTLNRDVRR
ncbi:amino acid ABC transporter permease [Fodinicurvata sp. EGI_FJ10296]|uniref:amino acid ABC transporter permease n=1 Tax=Fodinicurvata sp. EGI_FJ10296 TaxID=3231908 RepID=UPI003453D892